MIFISANAVRLGMALVEDYWPQLPAGLNWYAIGAATAEGCLSATGIAAITPGSVMSSEGFSLAIPALQDVREQRVLIVKGEVAALTDRRTQSPRRRGRWAACYRRSLPEFASRRAWWRNFPAGIDCYDASSGGKAFLRTCRYRLAVTRN